MKRIYAIISIAVIAALVFEYIQSSALPEPANQQHGAPYGVAFCNNAVYNAIAMKYAINAGEACFRTDVAFTPAVSSFISNESSHGAQFLGILDYETVGAQPSPSGCVSGCDWNLGTWNASVANAIGEYPYIRAWEIWNEPLVSNFMSGYADGNATHYFEMIRSAYNIIKSKDPNATIICFGGAELFPPTTASSEYQFYSAVWDTGAASYCNAISVHVYSQPYYDLAQQVYPGMSLAQEYNYTLGAYENLTGKPVWITELGVPSNNWTSGLSFSEHKQSAFLNESFKLFASHPFVKRIYWFHLVNTGGGADFGLLNATTLMPKPAWHAFLSFVKNSATT